MFKNSFGLFLLLLTASVCSAQIKSMEAFGSEFSPVPVAELKGKLLTLTDWYKGPSGRSGLELQDTVLTTTNREAILKLVDYNNKLQAWWQKKLNEEGDYFFQTYQSSIKHPNLRQYRLYVADTTGGLATDMYTFVMNLSPEVANMAAVPVPREVMTYFSQPGKAAGWRVSVIGRIFHAEIPAHDALLPIPKNAEITHFDFYYYHPPSINPEDGMEFPSFFDETWDGFVAKEKDNYPAQLAAMKRSKPDAWKRMAIHYIVFL